MTLLLLWAEWGQAGVVVVAPTQDPNNWGAFIDRRERRMERREWLVESRRRGGE